MSWEAALPYEVLSPLDNLDALSRVPLVSMAWMVRTPWHEETKRRCGISELARALVERDDIVLVATPTHRSLFETFAQEHFQQQVAFVPLAEVGKKFVAGRFQHQAAKDRTAGEHASAVKRY